MRVRRRSWRKNDEKEAPMIQLKAASVGLALVLLFVGLFVFTPNGRTRDRAGGPEADANPNPDRHRDADADAHLGTWQLVGGRQHERYSHRAHGDPAQ
jgi:hypothetical protein